MLDNYKNDKNQLLKQYNKMLEIKDIFPLDEIRAKRNSLEEEHFLVSFTGQIKAGKSTLINALLFGEPIIPADDTPHTAKITIIKYGEKPHLEATFYNEEEWNKLQENKEFYEEFLKPEVENAIGKGVYVKEVISKKAKIKEEKNLGNLEQYVARDGKYTPFVNLVTLYYPSDILKEITIVDTPGTNDPNKLRDEVAKKWIHKTHANVYVSYANQAMDKVDIDFIDEFLLSVPKEQKLTVINKIDSVNGMDGLESYLEELWQDESLKQREILTDQDSLVLVSGLGALLDQMLEKKIELDDDLGYYCDQLEEQGFLEAENHGLEKLKKTIEKKLIETKGANIIQAHKQFIDSLFKKKIQEIEKELEIEKGTLSDLTKNTEELTEVLASIKKNQKFIRDKEDEINKNFAIKKGKTLENLEIELNNILKTDKIEDKLKEKRQLSNYKNDVLWIVKDFINGQLEELKKVIDRTEKELNDFAVRVIQNLKEDLYAQDNTLELSGSSEIFTIYTSNLIDDMHTLADKNFDKETINNLVKKEKKFWAWTSTNREQINSALMKMIKETFNQSKIDAREKLNTHMLESIDEEILSKITEEIARLLENKKNTIEKNQEEVEEKEKMIAQSKEKIDRFTEELEKIKKYESEIE